MASSSPDFLQALSKVLAAEGYWADNPLDKGGETYQGISRKSWPAWEGWPIIDEYKRRSRPQPSPSWPIPGLEKAVNRFYYEKYWLPFRCGEVKNSQIRELLFDFFMGSGKAVQVVQRTLNAHFGARLLEDNRIGAATIAAINAAPAYELFERVKLERIAYYRTLDSWRHFGRGWMNRVSKFVWDGPVPVAGAGMAMLALAAFAWWIFYRK